MQLSNFEVSSNVTGDAPSRVAKQLLRLRNAFETQTGLADLSQASVRVYLFRRQTDFHPFRDNDSVRGFYRPAQDRDMIVLHESADDLLRVAFHEYTHLVLHRSRVALPLWLDEGLAEFFSTAVVDGRNMMTGRPVPSHVATLRTIRLVPLSKLEEVDRDSAFYRDAHALFYGESWALVHMLASERPYSERFPEWLVAITTGIKAADATRRIYGKTEEALLKDLQQYINAGVYSTRTLKGDSQDNELESVTGIPAREADVMLVRLLVELGRLDQAEERVRDMPDALVARAEIAMARGKSEEALLLFEKALARGTRTADTYYDYASLLYETKAPVNDVITLLRKSIDLQPDLYPARYLLGTILAKQGLFGDAIPNLEAALALQPHSKGVRQELEAARSKGAVPATPASTIRYPEKVRIDTEDVQGMLVQLDCLGELARLVVQEGGKRHFLLVTDPSAVTLKGSGVAKLEFGCGPVTPRKVRVAYRPSEDHVRGTAGEVVLIEFQ